MTPVKIAFWVAVAVIGYAYIGYPAIACGLARLWPRPVRCRPVAPRVTIVIAAHNEERRIAEKIENCLTLDYLPERLEIVVASDGSTDRTAAIVDDYVTRFPRRVRLVALPVRRGKSTALNTGASLASGEILVLADVRQRFEPGVVRALVRNFADPDVGAVSGDLVLQSADRGELRTGVGLYWRYEKMLRHAESRFWSSICYTGAISAIRRSLFTPLPVETLHDDFVMPLRVAATGYRVVFEPAARAFDWASGTPGGEFSRKVRTTAGVLQTLCHVGEFVGPLRPRVWWQFISHVALRIVVPYALAVALVTSVLLEGTMYRAAVAAQALVYGLGITGLLMNGRSSWRGILSAPTTLLVLNAAAVLGPLSYIAGRRLDLWRPSSQESLQTRAGRDARGDADLMACAAVPACASTEDGRRAGGPE